MCYDPKAIKFEINNIKISFFKETKPILMETKSVMFKNWVKTMKLLEKKNIGKHL